MNTLEDIERAIDGLNPEDLAKLYARLETHRRISLASTNRAVLEQGLGLFGSPEDAKLLDEVVDLAYEERRRPGQSASAG